MTMRAENWVGEYTSTVGVGDIVLGGPIDGFCGFANAGDGVDVYYTIMDGLNKETGIGTVVSGNLIRKTIHAVLLDGSYIKGGSPLQLSGDAQVYLTANANFMDNIQALDADLAQTIAQVASLSQVTINGYGLSGNITLNASDVHARPDSWMPNSNDVGSYSKADSDQRYVTTDAVEVGEQPGKIMIVGGPRDKQIAADIQNVSVVFVGQNPPLSPPDGKRWFDTTSGRTYIYYNDGDTKQWVEDSPQGNGLIDNSPLLIAMANPDFGPLSFRNILINGDMRINQRGFNGVYSSIADGAYGYDRWKKSGSNITQIVESGNFVKGAAYVLSGNGIQPIQMTAPLSGDWAISVINTATNIQLELGYTATPFEQRPISYELLLCQRYFRSVLARTTFSYMGPSGAMEDANGLRQSWLIQGMRIAPDVTVSGGFSGESFGGTLTFAGASIASTDYIRLSWTTSIASAIGVCTNIRDDGTGNAKILFNAEL